MTTAAAPDIPQAPHETSIVGGHRPARTISGCCQAILAHFAVEPDTCTPETDPAAAAGELRIAEVSRAAGHLAMTLLLPMPYGTERMTVSTVGVVRVVLPGMSLSPVIAAAAVRQPIGRLTGHPAFAQLDHILVTRVDDGHGDRGRPATILHFEDPSEPLRQVRRGATNRSVH